MWRPAPDAQIDYLFLTSSLVAFVPLVSQSVESIRFLFMVSIAVLRRDEE
jgi:hypothetical protein